MDADEAFVVLDDEDAFEGDDWVEEESVEETDSRAVDDADVEQLVKRFRDIAFRTGADIGLVDVERLAARRELAPDLVAQLRVQLRDEGLLESEADLELDAPGFEARTAPRATDWSSEALQMYLGEVGRYPLLTAEDERVLGRAFIQGEKAASDLAAYRGGDERVRAELASAVERGRRAKRRMIACNLRLVVSIAKRYRHRGLPFLDLIQDGTLGLIRAVEKFDPDLGFKFSTYATWWIRQSVERGLANTSRTIRLPVHVVERLFRVRRAQNALLAQLGREPRPEEVALAARVPLEDVLRFDALREIPSLDAPVGDGELVLGEVIAAPEPGPEDEVARAAAHETARRALQALSDRERRVLKLRFGFDGEPWTLDAIGQELDLTRERVRQIEGQALKKLRALPDLWGLQGMFGQPKDE
jgi:RNA polymerase sigma factor (sigma-70 family)